MLTAHHVAKYYGAHAAVRDLTVRVGAGEVVGLLGLNGAGKTTTLRMFSGLLTPTAGRIEIAGKDLMAAPERARGHLGFLPETPPLYPEMRVDAYLRFAARVRGVRRNLARALDATLAATALQDVAHVRIGTLSHGFQKRVGIAQAIIHRPQVILLDEPTSGLDPVQVVQMRQLIRSLRGSYTILISSHILGEIHQMCDRILVLHRGRVAAEGSEAELAGHMAHAARASLEVRGSAAALAAAIAGCQDAGELRIESEADGVVRASVALAGDAREALAAAVVHAGLGLRQLGRTRPELESIFLSLTGEGSSHTGEGPGHAGRGTEHAGEGTGRAGDGTGHAGEASGHAGEASGHAGEGSGPIGEASGLPATGDVGGTGSDVGGTGSDAGGTGSDADTGAPACR